MSGIDRITARIRGDAEADSAEALAAAKQEAEETIKRFEEEAAKLAREMSSHGAAQAKERIERLVGVAELEAGKNLLAAKQEMLDAAFVRALATIHDYSKEEYIWLLSELAVRQVRTGREQALLSENDRSKYGKEFLSAANAALAAAGKPASLSLSEDSAKIGSGLVIRDGDVEINCALETILHFMRGKVSREVAGILFG